MKAGELVRIRTSPWGPLSDEIGVLLNRQYLAYEAHNCRWRVLVNDKIKVVKAKNLRVVSKSVQGS